MLALAELQYCSWRPSATWPNCSCMIDTHGRPVQPVSSIIHGKAGSVDASQTGGDPGVTDKPTTQLQPPDGRHTLVPWLA
jgi:hypothetical protein